MISKTEKPMKTFQIRAMMVYALLLVFEPAVGQDDSQLITIPLSRPGEPVSLEMSILSARIEVIGEDRPDVEFTVSVGEGSRQIITPTGAKSFPGTGYSLDVDEKDNHISFDTDWRTNRYDVTVRIPRQADLELSTVNDGEIIVSNIVCNLELNNTNGPITASRITGSVIAESVNEKIDVSFLELSEGDAMAFSSINGDLILGIPAGEGVQLYLDSARGEIYSDFEVEVQPTKPVIERRENSGGIEVRIQSEIVANINGGGTVIKLKTLNGDIQIRKSE